MVEMTPELKELFFEWSNLTLQQKESLIKMIKSINNK